MNKIYSLLTVCSFATLGFSQMIEVRLTGGTTDISGTVQMVSATTDELVETRLIAKNITTGPLSVKITRYRLTTPPAGWTDALCWGGSTSGQCYSATQMQTNPWSTPPAGTLNMAAGTEAELLSHITPGVGGTATYRYYFDYNGGQHIDSVDVLLTSTLSVEEPEPVVGISVYPNPTSSVLTIATTGLTDGYQVRVTDVLGKVVYDETATATKKIDVSDFRNGVYLVTILEKGSAIQTKRIVVKH